MNGLLAMSQTTPKLRAATLDDFHSVYTIWMQDHVLPYMTFEAMDKEEFHPIFVSLFNSSALYVLTVNEAVVATMRIVQQEGGHSHAVELASFAVHQDHCRKGYGTLISNLLIEKIKKERPDVLRIEGIQETDNPTGIACFSKVGFNTEYTLPDWLRRKTGIFPYNKKWHVGAHFRVIFPMDIPTKSEVSEFAAELPTLKIENTSTIAITAASDAGPYECYVEQIPLCTVRVIDGYRRINHVQFWDIELHADVKTHSIYLEQALRQLAVRLSKKFKKIEISVCDKNTLTLIKKLGFYCRGIKKAGRKINNQFYDEVCADLSFFNIDDAIEMLNCFPIMEEKRKIRFIEQLNKCRAEIQKARQMNIIDDYLALYCENLCFQIVREQKSEAPLGMTFNQIDLLPYDISQCVRQLLTPL